MQVTAVVSDGSKYRLTPAAGRPPPVAPLPIALQDQRVLWGRNHRVVKGRLVESGRFHQRALFRGENRL
jgi:hypothetical protein